MPDLTRDQLQARLGALYEELGRFPAGVYCPWPLARVFNQLLAQSKTTLGADPIVGGIRLLEEHDTDEDAGTSTTIAGAVRGLVAQIRIALDEPARPAETPAQPPG
jgi:hypothetical protein